MKIQNNIIYDDSKTEIQKTVNELETEPLYESLPVESNALEPRERVAGSQTWYAYEIKVPKDQAFMEMTQLNMTFPEYIESFFEFNHTELGIPSVDVEGDYLVIKGEYAL